MSVPVERHISISKQDMMKGESEVSEGKNKKIFWGESLMC